MTDSLIDSGDGGRSVPQGHKPLALTILESIKAAEQQWLEAIGITTLRDLAHADADTIASQLDAINHSTSRDVINSWIFQAQTLLVETVEIQESLAVEPSSEETSSVSSQTSTPETAEKAWHPFATFAVRFESKQVEDTIQYQTSVRYIETGQVQTWSGIEADNLRSWLHNQLTDLIPVPSSTAALDSPTNVDSPTGVEASDVGRRVTALIQALRVYQPTSKETPTDIYTLGQTVPTSIKGNLPFILEVAFSIPEQDILATIRQTIFYEVECCARPLASGEILTLADILQASLANHQDVYTVQFPPMSLPAGQFRLQVLLKLTGIHAVPAFVSVSSLRAI